MPENTDRGKTRKGKNGSVMHWAVNAAADLGCEQEMLMGTKGWAARLAG